MLRITSKKALLGAANKKMQCDAAVVRVTTVAVTLPVARIRVELDVSLNPDAVDLDAAAGKVGASSRVPDTKIRDHHFLT